MASAINVFYSREDVTKEIIELQAQKGKLSSNQNQIERLQFIEELVQPRSTAWIILIITLLVIAFYIKVLSKSMTRLSQPNIQQSN